MMPTANNSLDILRLAQQQKLYEKLLLQLDKDFTRANVKVKIPKGMTPSDLKATIREKIYFLLVEHFDAYLNLLYAVDIKESEVKKIVAMDAVDMADEVCFLILKREWAKVWFKNQYTK